MAEVLLGLGSNLGDRVAHLSRALHAIGAVMSVDAVSSLWSTEPVGPMGSIEQPVFLNAAVRGRTSLQPRELLAEMADIERRMGRRRDVPGGPRTIDLDLLAYDELVVDEPGLSVPHPRMAARRFVLAPLAEIAAGARLRAGGPTVAELLAALPPAEAVERVDLPGWPPRLR